MLITAEVQANEYAESILKRFSGQPEEKIERNIIWGGDDFAGGYFEIRYENGLLIAIPASTSNTLFPSNQSVCERSAKSTFNDGLFKLSSSDLEKDLTDLYLDKRHILGSDDSNIQPIGYLNDLIIGGFHTWRLPTLKEVENSTQINKALSELCFDSKSFSILALLRGNTEPKHVRYISKARLTNGHYEISNNAPEYSTFFLVKPISNDLESILDNSKLAPTEKVFLLAEELADEKTPTLKIEAKLPIIYEPKTIDTNDLKQGPRESDVAFQKRKQTWLDNSTRQEIGWTENKNMGEERRYQWRKRNFDMKFEEDMNYLNNEYFKEEHYLDSLQLAFNLVFGQPRYKDIRHDSAQKKIFATVYSPFVDNFENHIEFEISKDNYDLAIDYMESRKIMPVGWVSQRLELIDTINVVNEAKAIPQIKFANIGGKSEHYAHFIENYSYSRYTDAAISEFKNIEYLAIEDQRNIHRRKQEAQKREERDKIINDATLIFKSAQKKKKKVGDLVCTMVLGLPGTGDKLSFPNPKPQPLYEGNSIRPHKFDIKGRVEEVIGDMITVKIIDGASGGPLNYVRGSDLSIRYDAWPHCNLYQTFKLQYQYLSQPHR